MEIAIILLVVILFAYVASTVRSSYLITEDLKSLSERIQQADNVTQLQSINREFDRLSRAAMLPNHFNAVDEIRQVLKTKNRLNKVKSYE